MNNTLTVECKVHFTAARHGRQRMKVGATPPAVPLGHIPRVSRLMALAIRFDGLLKRGDVQDYADLARLGHVSRPRVTQIMNLLNLAPDIQEALLFLPPDTSSTISISGNPPPAPGTSFHQQQSLSTKEAHAKAA